MEYIRVTKDNLEQEHICCAISNNKDVQVSSKKAWLADRFDDGLVFLKSVERGKCFIEYIGMCQGQQGQGKDRALHPFLGQEETFPFRPEILGV